MNVHTRIWPLPILVVAGLSAAVVGGTTQPATAAPPVTVGMAYTGELDGDVFQELMSDGAAQAASELRVKVRELDQQSASGKLLDQATVIDRLAKPNTDLVIAGGFPYADAVVTAATAHPDINFAVMDTEIASPPANVAGLKTADNEGAFMVGAAAGLRSATHRIGFLGATQIDLIRNFEVGFVAGVQQVDPTSTVTVDYIADPGDFSGFTDPDRAYELATAMYASGVDVIFPPAGASTIGVTFAARDHTRATGDQVWMVGVDFDFYAQLTGWGGEYLTLRPHVLTSMLKRFDVVVHDTIVAQANGIFTAGNHVFGLVDDAVDYSTSGGFVDDVVPTLEQLRRDIIDGTIVVPTYP